MVYRILLTGLLAVSIPQLKSQTIGASHPETGRPFLRNYQAKEYKAATQNWAIVQDRRGVMYFGNTDGFVLEYDGATWRLLRSPNSTPVRSLAIDSNGRVYAGAEDELGYLAPDSSGKMQFYSLLEHVRPEDRPFSDIRRMFASKDGVFFQTHNRILFWTNGQMKIWKAKTVFHLAFYVMNQFFVRQEGIGLMRLTGDSLELVPDGDLFKDERIYAMLPSDPNSVVIATRTAGLFLFDGRQIKPFPTDADVFFRENQIYHGLVLPDGGLLFATLRGGAAALYKDGTISRIYDESAGLQNNSVFYAENDRQGGLWLALNDGISRIDVSSPFSIYDELSGLTGMVLSVHRHNGVLYAGTFNGLFRLEPSVNKIKHAGFVAVPGIATQVWSIVSFGRSLLAATNEGVYQIDGSRATAVTKELALFICRSKQDPERFYVGGFNGVRILRARGSAWDDLGKINGIDAKISSIQESDDGSLWVGTVSHGVLKITFSKNSSAQLDPLLNPQIEHFDKEQKLPLGRVDVSFVNKELIFSTPAGFCRYNRQTHTFFPDPVFRGETAISSEMTPISQNVDGNVWIWSNDGIQEFSRTSDTEWRLQKAPYQRIPQSAGLVIYPEDNGVIWFGGSEGLFRYDSRIQKNYKTEFQALIRKVIVNGDSVIFWGDLPDKGRMHISLPYELNSLRFEGAAASFDNEAGNEFCSFLQGYDDQWSSWSNESRKDYTKIPEGKYVFHIRARNIFGVESTESKFEFEIRPPWYRTWWMDGLYLILFLIGAYVLVKWRARTLENEKHILEKTVEDRTVELVGQKEKLEMKTAELEAINIIVKSINTEISLSNLLRTVLEETRVMLKGMEKASVLIHEGDSFRFKACYGWDMKELEPVGMTLKETEDRYVDCSEQIHDDIFIAKKVSERPGQEKFTRLGIIQSMLILRIRIAGKVEGYFIFDNTRDADAFDDHDIELLTHLKEHIVSAFIKIKLLEELRQLNDKKNEFLGVAAHDLRNPLSAMTGFISAIIQDMKEGTFDMSQGIQDMQDVLAATQRMTHLVSELLDIAAIESGKVSMDLHQESLNVILDECEKFNARTAAQKDIRLRVEKNVRLPELVMDKVRIAEVIDNLLSNAIKYTYPGGEIRVHSKQIRNEVVTSVQDSGQGLNENDLQHIFSSFKRLSARPTAGETSTGLGLAIVKKIVEMHGGRVWVESVKGQGSTFSFSLPIHQTKH